MSDLYLVHSAKGSSWEKKDHKYASKKMVNGKWIYKYVINKENISKAINKLIISPEEREANDKKVAERREELSKQYWEDQYHQSNSDNNSSSQSLDYSKYDSKKVSNFLNVISPTPVSLLLK